MISGSTLGVHGDRKSGVQETKTSLSYHVEFRDL